MAVNKIFFFLRDEELMVCLSCVLVFTRRFSEKKKMHVFFVNLDKVFDREWRCASVGNEKENNARNVDVMNLCQRAKTRARVDSELSEEFEANVWIHQASVLSFSLFSVVVNVVTELACEVVLSELLYAEDLILMTETIIYYLLLLLWVLL